MKWYFAQIFLIRPMVKYEAKKSNNLQFGMDGVVVHDIY